MSVEQATESGRKAGIARRNRDQCTVTHWQEYQRKCLASCTTPEERKAMADAYSKAYSEEATPAYTPFR